MEAAPFNCGCGAVTFVPTTSKPNGSRLIFTLSEQGKSVVKTEQELLNIIHSAFPFCQKWETTLNAEDGTLSIEIHLSYIISRGRVVERLRRFAPLLEFTYLRREDEKVIEGCLQNIISRMEEIELTSQAEV
jgi:hypothetical protein